MTSSLVPDINICQGNVTGFFLNHVIDDHNTDPCLLLAMTLGKTSCARCRLRNYKTSLCLGFVMIGRNKPYTLLMKLQTNGTKKTLQSNMSVKYGCRYLIQEQ